MQADAPVLARAMRAQNCSSASAIHPRRAVHDRVSQPGRLRQDMVGVEARGLDFRPA